jgi:hypothetical protein
MATFLLCSSISKCNHSLAPVSMLKSPDQTRTTVTWLAVASSAGLYMGFSLRMGFDKKNLPDSSGEMPAEEAIG